MGILTWLVLGLVVGVLAKFIMPGEDPGGFVVTILIGIAGAFVGGFVGSMLGLGDVTGFKPGISRPGHSRGDVVAVYVSNVQIQGIDSGLAVG